MGVSWLCLGHDGFVDRNGGAWSADLDWVGQHLRRADLSDEVKPVGDGLVVDTELHETYVDSCLETRSSEVV